MGINIFSQQWKSLVTEDFGNQTTQDTRSQTPAADLNPGVTDYIPVINNSQSAFSFNDGNYMVGSSSMAPRNTVTQSGIFISGVLDHTTTDPVGTFGNLMAINANPAKQGEDIGTYYMYSTTVFDIPGANYRVSFWGANLLKRLTAGKVGHIGLSIRDQNNTSGSLYASGVWQLPKTTDNTNTTLPWIRNELAFTLPINYAGSGIYFNFYNSDTNSSTSGNDLVLDDILIELYTVDVSGKVFVDENANGIQDAVDTNLNGLTTPLYAYVVSSVNKVVSKAQVAADGSYSFSTDTGVPFSANDIGLRIILSSQNLAKGATLGSSDIINKTTVSENVSLSNNPTYLSTGSINGVISLTKSDVNITNVNFGVRPFCYKPGVVGSPVLDTKHGITSLARAEVGSNNWPGVRKGAYTVLESKTKGFVINRLTTAQIDAIPVANLIDGMMVYDTIENCLKLYFQDTITPSKSKWSCLETQYCPD